MTDPKPQPPVYGQRAAGLATCGFGTGDPECGQPAVVHALFDNDEGHNGLMCTRHWLVFQANFKCVDVHDFGGSCTMPGSVWVFSTPTIHPGAPWLVTHITGGCTIPIEEEPTP